MNTRTFVRALTTGLATGLCLKAGAEVPVVRWLVLDFHPYHITTAPQQGQGVRDKYLHALQAELPQLSHITVVANLPRMAGLMQACEPVCTNSQLKTRERENFAVFSRWSYGHQLPIRLVVVPTQPSTAAGGGEPLERSGRCTQRRPRARHGIRFSSDSVQAAQTRLMELGRFDCARSEQGEAVIAAVNARPKGAVAQQAMRKEYEALLPTAERQRYRKQLERRSGDPATNLQK